ncbi:hypothetical protein LX64_04119 [Chitinophaga skermanii]|uniref:Uncharacterized protein n=1 Tax=Chitinophaga skermanii TaxID=331697 RepID=A0A327QB31_9BACT|nr:hypothetical protein [Chitinophaga skermanii]RAJ00413.1 hypothetical protein LX64_04119 [Chitinophaga skermanii]
MRLLGLSLLLLLASVFSACGQVGNHQHPERKQMTYDNITHPVAKAAIIAWQKGDAKTWRSYFADTAKLLDDGHPRDLIEFSTEAIRNERFTTIDKVEDNGLSIYGRFHSDTWGDFIAYFSFTLNEEGKIKLLRIGQARY